MKKLLLVLLVALTVSGPAFAYPTGAGEAAFWPDPYGKPLDEDPARWEAAFADCEATSFATVKDLPWVEPYKNEIQDRFINNYLSCIHAKGYPNVAY